MLKSWKLQPKFVVLCVTFYRSWSGNERWRIRYARLRRPRRCQGSWSWFDAFLFLIFNTCILGDGDDESRVYHVFLHSEANANHRSAATSTRGSGQVWPPNQRRVLRGPGPSAQQFSGAKGLLILWIWAMVFNYCVNFLALKINGIVVLRKDGLCNSIQRGPRIEHWPVEILYFVIRASSGVVLSGGRSWWELLLTL